MGKGIEAGEFELEEMELTGSEEKAVDALLESLSGNEEDDE